MNYLCHIHVTLGKEVKILSLVVEKQKVSTIILVYIWEPVKGYINTLGTRYSISGFIG